MKTLALAAIVAIAPMSSQVAPVSDQEERVYRYDDPGVSAPKVAFHMSPTYTVAAMRAGIQGSMTIEAVVGVDGRPRDVVVTRSLDSARGLDAKGVEAVKAWRFRPGTLEGKSVPVRVEIELTFRIGQRGLFTDRRADTPVPLVLFEQRPEYTEAAKKARVEGSVELECLVGTDGVPREIRVVRSLDTEHGLDQNAIEALREWRFAPARVDGKDVPARVSVEMTFTLRDRN